MNNNYFESLVTAKQKWTRGHSSLRLIAELQRQFPAIEPLQIENDFFETMGDYPEPNTDDGGGDGIYY